MEGHKLLALQSYEHNFQSISTLGNGSFGTVVLAKYRHEICNLIPADVNRQGTMLEPLLESSSHLSSLVAIKTMKKKLSSIAEYSRVKEYMFIIAVPSHPSLVQIYQTFIDDKELSFHIVMESMNQNLYQLMKARKNVKFSPATLKSILCQLADGIRHIHKHGYFHRDIKPENILVCSTAQYYGEHEISTLRKHDTYIIKIADYGLARHVSNFRPYTAYVSTRWYRSPEILLRRKWYSKPVDIWAFGTVAVEIATFSPLFPGANELDQTWKILEVLGCPSRLSELKHTFSKRIAADHTNCAELSTLGLLDMPLGDSPAPLGGFWEEAQVLASKLGFVLPSTDGVTMRDILPDDSHQDLADMVQACLSWNPDTRIDIELICKMEFFKDTHLILPQKEPLRLYPETHSLAQVPTDENTDPELPQTRLQRKRHPFRFASFLRPKKTRDNGDNFPLASTFNPYDDADDGYGMDLMRKYASDYFDGDLRHEYAADDQQYNCNDIAGGYADYIEDVIEYQTTNSKKVGAEYSWEASTHYGAPSVLGGEARLSDGLGLFGDVKTNEDDEKNDTQVGEVSIGSMKEIRC